MTTSRPPAYAELHAHSWYSFLDAVDAPSVLVEEAARLGLSGLALTDHDGLYGAVSMAVAARGTGLKTVFGAELNIGLTSPRTGTPDPDGTHLLVLAGDPAGYRRLSAAIADAHLAGGEKGRPVYDLESLAAAAQGGWEILTGCRKSAVPRALATGGPAAADRQLTVLCEMFDGHVHVELTRHDTPGDAARNDALAELAARYHLPTVATGAIHYARPSAWPTYTATAAIRARRSLDDLDSWLPAGPTAFLRSPAEMTRRFARYPGAVAQAADLAERCAIDFDRDIRARPPRFPVPEGHTEDSFLRELVAAGLERRYGSRSHRPDAWRQADHELKVIADLGFSGWFLISWDVVRFCRAQDPPILAQGRGSAANSLVVHVLDISAVCPLRYGLLFSRFLHPDRDGPPDIDLDIQASRREEVIQYVYGKYGRRSAAMVANEITMKPKLALREAARALGYSIGATDAISGAVDGHGPLPTAVQADADGVPAAVLELAERLHRMPRHLGIHSGGVVLCEGPISEVLPVEWARMPGRSVVQGDKETVADAGLIKHDLLGLRALDVVADAMLLLREQTGRPWTLADFPADDENVFKMIQDGDTVAVFQLESRAQQSVSPIMKARSFHDVAVQIALIRPGPGGSGASRRYLRRRNGQDPTPAIHPIIDTLLADTYNTVLFQEQAMEIAIDAAGFTPGEADLLRRAMGSKRSAEQMQALAARFFAGLAEHGITGKDAEDIFAQIESFSGYGFPESHALSFAFIALGMAWLKRYHPALLLVGMLNHQPMGFYEPPTLIADAIRHDVPIRPVDINLSRDKAVLEPLTPAEASAYRRTHVHSSPDPQPPVRLGLAGVRGVGDELAARIVAERDEGGPFADVEDLARRTEAPAAALENLAMAGALDVFDLGRRELLWAVGAAAGGRRDHLPGTTPGTNPPRLAPLTVEERTLEELWAGQHAAHHPLTLVRERLAAAGYTAAADLTDLRDGQLVRVAGLVTHRQRPPTAGGVCFLGLEDETGLINVIVPAATWDTHKRRVRESSALMIHGTMQSEHGSVNVLAGRLDRLTISAPDRSRSYR